MIFNLERQRGRESEFLIEVERAKEQEGERVGNICRQRRER